MFLISIVEHRIYLEFCFAFADDIPCEQIEWVNRMYGIERMSRLKKYIRGKIIHHYRCSSNLTFFGWLLREEILVKKRLKLERFSIWEVISSWDSSFDFDEIIHSGEFWRCIESWSRNTLNIEKWTIFNGCSLNDVGKKEKIKAENWFKLFIKFWWCARIEFFIGFLKYSQWDAKKNYDDYERSMKSMKITKLYRLNHEILDSPRKVLVALSQVVVFYLMLLCGL